jgi:hypothetical protein
LKKLITIFFLLGYLFASTEAKQLFKIPVIFQHYAEHRLENNHLSLIDFLDMHYMHGSPFDQDYDRDMKLPFKTTGDVFSFFPITVDKMPAEVMMVCPQASLQPLNKIPRSRGLGTSLVQRIWQPPRFLA